MNIPRARWNPLNREIFGFTSLAQQGIPQGKGSTRSSKKVRGVEIHFFGDMEGGGVFSRIKKFQPFAFFTPK